MQTYRSAWRIFCKNWLLIGLAMFVKLVSEEYDVGHIVTKPSVGIWVLFAVHRTALLGEPRGPAVHVDPILPDKAFPDYPKPGFWVLMFGYVGLAVAFGFWMAAVLREVINEELSNDSVVALVAMLFAILAWFLFWLWAPQSRQPPSRIMQDCCGSCGAHGILFCRPQPIYWSAPG